MWVPLSWKVFIFTLQRTTKNVRCLWRDSSNTSISRRENIYITRSLNKWRGSLDTRDAGSNPAWDNDFFVLCSDRLIFNIFWVPLASWYYMYDLHVYYLQSLPGYFSTISLCCSYLLESNVRKNAVWWFQSGWFFLS